MTWLIIGLGNPGSKYRLTRHNVGFMVVDFLANVFGLRWKHAFLQQSLVSIGSYKGVDFCLAKPLTFMNLSGQAASRLVKKFRVSLEKVVVVHDDMDIKLGKIKIKKGGGSAGHKGVESVISSLGSSDFIRVRVGVGRPQPGFDVVEYLLSDFSSDELKVLRKVSIPKAADSIKELMVSPLQKVMSIFNA